MGYDQADHAAWNARHRRVAGYLLRVRTWTAFIDKSWIYAVVALISLAACVGTAFLKSWSRDPVYVLTVGFVAAWCYSVYMGVQAGFFAFFFSSPAAAARSLAPGLVLACLSLVCSYVVFRHFDISPRLDQKD